MTIKKTIKVPNQEANSAGDSAVSETPAKTGATIADRFKLDAPPTKKSGPAGASATIAAVAAVVALAVAGVLTFMLYQHFEFLKGT